MIKQLYDLEDRLFYASRRCGPARSRRLEVWSVRIGRLADFLQAGVWRNGRRVLFNALFNAVRG